MEFVSPLFSSCSEDAAITAHFLSCHPMNWLQGEAQKLGQLMAQEWEQPMAWEGKAQTPAAGATPSHSSGNKHSSEHRNHQEITALRKALVFST